MNKPIEPGCLAIIIRGRPANVGKVVTVLRYDPDDGFWEIRASGRELDSDHGLVSSGWVLGRELLRIDGGEDESVTERQGEEVEALAKHSRLQTR